MTRVLSQMDSRGVLTLSMNRPEVHNAFDEFLIDELTAALCAAEKDPQLRVLVLTGTGKSFSAGADIGWMQRMVHASQKDNEADALHLGRLLRTLNFFPCPTVARINGAALGGGSGLVACCDFAISSEAAVFGFTEARLGLVPAMISPYVTEAIGPGQARRFFLTGERFGAKTARRIGLVHEICDADQLDVSVESAVSGLLRSGPRAARECKHLVRHVSGRNREQQKQLDGYTAALIARIRVSPEGQEGLRAFLSKTDPSWVSGADE